MATETLYADGVLASSTISNPANAVGSTLNTWAGDVNANVNCVGAWSMPTPSGALTGQQIVYVRCRKGSNSNNPTIDVQLHEAGTLIASAPTRTVLSATPGDAVIAFDGSVVTDPSAVEIVTVITGAGGSPSARNSVQVDSIRWVVSYTTVVNVDRLKLGGASPTAIKVGAQNATAVYAGAVKVWP